MKKLFALLTVLILTSGWSSCDVKPYLDAWDSFQEWNDEYGQTKPPSPVNPVKPPEKPSEPGKPPDPAPQPVSPTGSTVLFDLDPERGVLPEIRRDGFESSDNGLFYVFFCKVEPWTWPQAEAESTPDGRILYAKRDQIAAWIDNRINAGAARLRADPGLQMVMVANDAHDRCGERIAHYALVIRGLGQEFGGRVSSGVIYRAQ